MSEVTRCGWAIQSDALYTAYHDQEWGVPVFDDHALFERITLEGAQAGLSWITVLRKRDAYRRAFAGFDPARIALYTETDVERLMADPGIIRNRAKIMSTIGNARSFLQVQAEHGSFSVYLWRYVDEQPIQNRWQALNEIPAETDVSRNISKNLRQRGFRFVGPTICYAMMQACGMVNDHVVTCFRHAELGGTA